MKAWLAWGVAVLAGCGGTALDQGGKCDAGGGGNTTGSGGAPAPGVAVCAEVAVTSWSCVPNNYHAPLVGFVRDAGIIFRGTVKELHAVTPGIPFNDTSRSVVAHVDQVLEEGDVLMLEGQDVTIQLLAAPTMAVGYSGYFFTNVLQIGQTMAVAEVAHLDPGVYPDLEADVPGIEALLADERLHDRMATAGSVVVGTVSAITTFPDHPTTSEHDPLWAVATLDVDCTLLGAPLGAARVAFASSTDVMWFHSPKLTQGQQGVFLLQPVPLQGGMFAMPVGAPHEVDQALDVQPTSERPHLATLALCPPAE